MCAGVGKTYTMLQTAHAEKLKGNDIIIGYVETHNREETAELAEGFELIPRKTTNTNPPPFRKWIWMPLLPGNHRLLLLMNWHIPMLPEAAMQKDIRMSRKFLKAESMFIPH